MLRRRPLCQLPGGQRGTSFSRLPEPFMLRWRQRAPLWLISRQPGPVSPSCSSSQKSCCSGLPGSAPEKANHINDSPGTVGAREGTGQGPQEPLPVQSKRGPALDKLCLNETTWGETGGHTTPAPGISQVHLESHAAYLCLILETPAISPVPGRKNARNVAAFPWVSPPPSLGPGGCTYKARPAGGCFLGRSILSP